jgi:hypothetical protein
MKPEPIHICRDCRFWEVNRDHPLSPVGWCIRESALSKTGNEGRDCQHWEGKP